MNVISAQSLQEGINHQINGCPYGTYVFVSQPGVSTNDLTLSKSTPHLRRRLSAKDDNVKSVFTAKNVVGEVDAMALVATVNRECNTKSTLLLDGESTSSSLLITHRRHTDRETEGEIPTQAYDAIHLRFPNLPTDNDDRESALLQADSYLNSLLATLDSYTVIYAPLDNMAPAQVQHPEQYEMDEPYPSNMHTDLKRDLNAHIVRASNASNPQADLPLFEKYQFLSPGTSCCLNHRLIVHRANSTAGIFMGGVVSILLFSILYVGISAIANLEVSYMAFSKEMGPAAQKKQQQ